MQEKIQNLQNALYLKEFLGKQADTMKRVRASEAKKASRKRLSKSQNSLRDLTSAHVDGEAKPGLMTASDMENMSLIMEEEIVHFISQIKDEGSGAPPSRETNHKPVEDRGIQYDDPIEEMSQIIKNEVL